MYCMHHTSLLTNDLLSVKLFPHLTNWSYMRGPTDFLTEWLKVLNVLKIKILIKCKITLDFHFISHHFTEWYARLMQMYSMSTFVLFLGNPTENGSQNSMKQNGKNTIPKTRFYTHRNWMHSNQFGWMYQSNLNQFFGNKKKGWVWICCQNKCCTRTHTQHQNSVKNQSILHLNILRVDFLLQQQQQQ